MLSQLLKSTTRYYTVQVGLCIIVKVVPHLGTACRQLCNFCLELICRNTSLRFQAPRSSKAASVAVLVPEYEGHISDPFASSQQTVPGGVVFVDCNAAISSQPAVHASSADTMPSEADVAPDMSSSDQLDTALDALDNPRVAQPPCLQSTASVDVSPLAPCQPDFCFFDASDSKTSLAEALARLCKRASEDGQARSANQSVTGYQQQHAQEAAANTLSLSAAAATPDTVAVDSSQSSANLEENLNTACSVSADDAAETVSDDHMAIVDALMTSEVQHAEVDQVLDELLAEVSAPFQPVQSSLPAGSSEATLKVSLPSNLFATQHAEVDQVVDDLLAEVSAPLPPMQSSLPADNAMMNVLVSNEAQHAAVDQVVDRLLARVAAPFQPVQSSMLADIGGMFSPIVSPRVSLPANFVGPQHAAVHQVLDELLPKVSAPLQAFQSGMPAGISGRVSPMVSPRVSLPTNCFAPQQVRSLPAVTAPDSCCVSSTSHSQPLPAAVTAAKRSSAELSPAVPSSSSSGKENSPVVEARNVSKSMEVNLDRAVVGAMGGGRDRVCCLHTLTFQQMAQALPTEPASQVVRL